MIRIPIRFNSYARVAITFAMFAIFILGCGGGSNPIAPGDIDAGENLTGQLTTGPSSASLTAAYKDYLNDEVLIVLNDNVPMTGASMVGSLPLRHFRTIECRWGTIYRMKITDGTPVETVVAQVKTDPRVRFVEPNYIYQALEEPYFPNDPMWAADGDPVDPKDSPYDQWGPAMVGANVVWNDSNGSEDVVVCVMDTGVRYDHEDLNDNLWINEDEIPDNGIDDDTNGYIDDWWGWDVYDDDNDPYDDGAYASYHGTACSGVVAATQDNFRGVSGVAPGVKIMAVKVDLTGGGNLGSSIAAGLAYVTSNECDIVSMSFRNYTYSEIMETACNDAWDSGNGVILMGGIGNESTTELCYPNAYDSVMAIGGTCPWTEGLQPRDEKRIVSYEDGYYWGSNYGEHMTVMGYGAQYTTTYGGHYDSYWDGGFNGFFGGTSCATPFSAGVMALIRSYFPSETPAWSWTRIEETADDLDVPGFDIETGYGRVNALRAVYGSDRYEADEDLLGFVSLDMPSAHVFDTIHDVPGNPYHDTEDLFRFVVPKDGGLIVELDINTWGENLDLELYSDEAMTAIVDSSTVDNHYDSSTESIFYDVLEGEEYFLRVLSPAPGNSTAYGLFVHVATNELFVTGEDITPDFLHHGGTLVPFLKLTCEVGLEATLDEIIVSKSGTLTNQNWVKARLYQDSNYNGEFDNNDALVAEEIPPSLNRAVLGDIGIEWTYELPLVLFVVGDISETLAECDVRLSLESYKDVTTVEGIEAHYTDFPIVSGWITIGTDSDPPTWVTTIGVQTADPSYKSVYFGWNEATDLQTPPCKYNVYYTDTLPFDIGTATPVYDVPFVSGDTTDYEYKVSGLTEDVEWHFVVRAEDQAGNEEDNLAILSATPSGGCDPEHPMLLDTESGAEYPMGIDINDNALVIADIYGGLLVYDRSDPADIEHVSTWNGGYTYGVVCDNTYAYVGSYSAFYLVDISVPGNPTLADTNYSSVMDPMVRYGDWIYSADYNADIQAVDISDPFNPITYGTTTPYSEYCNDIEVSGNELYMCLDTDGVVALDRSIPSAPVVDGVFGGTFLQGICTTDDLLITMNYWLGTVTLYDIATDPADPPVLASIDDGPGTASYDSVVRGDYLYVTRSDYGLVVFEISDPADPNWVGDLELVGVSAIVTDGTFIYTITSNGLVHVII